jgi:hypothetical protein
MKKPFIFTEAYDCGKIANVAIESFLKFHPKETINVFGKNEDFEEIKNQKGVNFISLDHDQRLKELYEHGHAGTSYIFASVISKKFGDYDRIVHFDSDVLFRGECLSEIYEGFEDGFHLIGQRRNYEKNRPGLTLVGGRSVVGIPDTVGTCIFALDLSKVTVSDFELLRRLCVGGASLTGEPILDFFDPVSFHVMSNQGKVKYLSSIDYGAGDENGNWDNGHHELNLLCDFGEKFVHFAGIGSGLKFIKKGNGSVPDSYAEWAKKRYNIYAALFLFEEIRDDNKEDYEKFKQELNL